MSNQLFQFVSWPKNVIKMETSKKKCHVRRLLVTQQVSPDEQIMVYEVAANDHEAAAGNFSQLIKIYKNTSKNLPEECKNAKQTDNQAITRSWLFRMHIFRSLAVYFLPADYPHSVRHGYWTYTKWSFAQMIASAAGGILCTQSLLVAVGVGSSTALPAAAVVNWVLKDGLGQLGGVLLAGLVGRRFDDEAKRWRMLSALSLDASQLLEIITPLFPAMFVPLASIANVGKNISWLSASASKASLHRSLCAVENLADLTAKSGSQAIAASLIGTTIGILTGQLIGPMTASNTLTVLAAYSLFTVCHLYTSYRAVESVALNTVNEHRGERLILHFIETGTLLTPDALNKRENVLLPYVSPLHKCTRLRWSGGILGHVKPRSCDVTALADTAEDMRRLLQRTKTQNFAMSVRQSPKRKLAVVLVVLFEKASASDVFAAFAASVHLRHAVTVATAAAGNCSLSEERLLELLNTTLTWTIKHRQKLWTMCQQSGWSKFLFIERNPGNRLHLANHEAQA